MAEDDTVHEHVLEGERESLPPIQCSMQVDFNVWPSESNVAVDVMELFPALAMAFGQEISINNIRLTFPPNMETH